MAAEHREPARRPEAFDEAALDYGIFRPPYPPKVITVVVSAGHITGESRVLEIACGTGQLTVGLAPLGCELLAVEMGSNLARMARQNLAPYPNARVDVGRYEEWVLPGNLFDAVVCASAFHWLDPGVRFSKSADALRPGGALVIVHVHHVRGGTPGFFEDTQPLYMKWGLSHDPFFQPPTATALPPTYPELDLLRQFHSIDRQYLEIPREQTTESYVGLLRTDSLILALEPEARRGFLDDIAELVESRYQGTVTRNFVYEVISARRA
jgi:protein-L-isoaspartate O-methyltransferase